MKCPTCGCEKFFIKDEDDEYEVYEFSTASGEVVFNDSIATQNMLKDEVETYCDKCAWHGSLSSLNK